MKLKRRTDGTTKVFGHTSRNDLVWFWHVIFDGTPLCRCVHSEQIRDARKGWQQ
jgi:hypothetical protein